MKANEAEDFVFGTYRWVIDNFSQVNRDKHYSDVFVIGGFKWRMLIRSIGLSESIPNTRDQFSLYLGVADASILPAGWARYANFTLTLVNQLDTKKSITKPAKDTGNNKEFKENSCEWGFKSFMPLREFYDSSAGYLVNDTCIVEVKVNVLYNIGDEGSHISATLKFSNKEHNRQERTGLNSVQSADTSPAPKTPCPQLVLSSQDSPSSEKVCTKPTDDGPAESSLVKEVGEVTTNPMAELMEFRGFGLMKKTFVPLLEEVCSFNPSFTECLRNRSPKVTECALTTLGELLHFLKTTKIKDMNEDACERLQNLWLEVQMFKFDLKWLEPQVRSALGMKKLLERARRLKRLREDVDVLDNEKKRRTAALAFTEADLEVAKRDLAKEEEGFVERDMDNVLGYVMH